MGSQKGPNCMGGRTPFVVTADLDGKINYWSPRATEVFGIDETDAVGLNLAKRIFERNQLSKGYGVLASVANGDEWEGKIYCRRRDGGDFPVLLKVGPILDPEGITVGMMAVGQVLPQRSMQGIDVQKEYSAYLIGECNLTPATAFAYNQGEKRAEKFIGKSVADFAVDDMRRFLRDTPYHPATKNATLVSVKAKRRWLLLEGYIESDPIQAMRGPKMVRNTKPSLELDEVRELLEMCHRPHEFRVVWLGLYAGLRVSESARIGTDEGHWKKDRLHFLGKGRKWREVPVHPMLETQRDLILCRSASADTLKGVCRSLSFVTGIPFSSHSLRRTFGVALSEIGGVDRDTIGDLMGHAPSSVTVSAYVPIRWQEKVEAVGRLSYDIDAQIVVPEAERQRRRLELLKGSEDTAW